LPSASSSSSREALGEIENGTLLRRAEETRRFLNAMHDDERRWAEKEDMGGGNSQKEGGSRPCERSKKVNLCSLSLSLDLPATPNEGGLGRSFCIIKSARAVGRICEDVSTCFLFFFLNFFGILDFENFA